MSAITLTAPAKLTLSLRITGVRADGMHLIDAEMISLSLHDVLTIDPGGELPPYRPRSRDRGLDLVGCHRLSLCWRARNFGTHIVHASTTRSSMVCRSSAASRATTQW